MKVFLITLGLLCSTVAFSQHASGVEIALSADSMKKGEGIQFTVSLGSPMQLEVAVFSDTQAVFVNRTWLSASENTFDVPAKDLYPGRYYVLVTANGIHEQKSFCVVK